MKTTEPIKYRGYTYWIAGTDGAYRGYVEAVPRQITPSKETFASIADAKDFLFEQIDLACGDPRKYVANRGFTLIEILVVIAMLGILSAIAAPGFVGFVNRQRLKDANEGAIGAINRAKSEAKRDKVSRTAEFRMNGAIAEYAVYTEPSGAIWQKLGDVTVTPAIATFNSKGSPSTIPVTVTVTTANSIQKRCVSVITLIGGVKQGSDSECP
jgi:prepilin-type N-terminal cleavage/methylation domain-containing protein